MNHKHIIIISISTIFTIVMFVFIYLRIHQVQEIKAITSFKDCVAAGYPVMESFPEQCHVPGGQTFTNVTTGQPITVAGEIVCLPHRNTSGPQTLECAFGIKENETTYYAIRDGDMRLINSWPIKVGKKVKVSGILLPGDVLGMGNYNIVGIIDINSID